MKRGQPWSGCAYTVCCMPCYVLAEFSPCQHCLLVRVSVWDVNPSRHSSPLPVRQQASEQWKRASTASLSSSAPLSGPLPRPPQASPPTSRVWLCLPSTGCVRTTASGLSGAFPSKTCPGKSVKMKTHYKTEMRKNRSILQTLQRLILSLNPFFQTNPTLGLYSFIFLVKGKYKWGRKPNYYNHWSIKYSHFTNM